MYDSQVLNQNIAEFESDRKSYGKEYGNLESLRKEFIRLYPISSIPTLPIEKYVIGRGNKDSFCYWLENRLVSLGNMYGATAFKFGIYFGHTKSSPDNIYRFQKRFGNTVDTAYETVREQLVYLLSAGVNKNIQAIRENMHTPMFKGKILSTYFPDQYLNVFSDDHLSYFLEV